MSKPHHKPKNVTLTGPARLCAPQQVGSRDFTPGGEKNWFLDEDYLYSRRILEQRLANGWQGYGGGKRKTAQRKISQKDVRAWMVANRDLATSMMMEVWR